MTETQIHQARLQYKFYFNRMASRPEVNWCAMPSGLTECGCYIVPLDESINLSEPHVQNVQSMTEETFILRLVDAQRKAAGTHTTNFKRTHDKLQAHLVGEIKDLCGYPFKAPVKAVRCKDGTTLSVQASVNHYSSPRADVGPYTQVEVWNASAPVTEFDYSEDEPSAYVDIQKVVKLIDNHGGLQD